MRLIMRKGHGSRIINTHNNILYTQSRLLGNAALSHLKELERDRVRERDTK